MDSRDQNSWTAEARSRPASTRGTISGHGASMGVMNDVSEQRYHNAVDGMENGMEDLEIRDGHLTAQIRIVFSTISTLHG